MRKVQPLQRALAGASAWVTGMRREQSVTRSNLGGGRARRGEAARLVEAEPAGQRGRSGGRGPSSRSTACPRTRCTAPASRRSAARLARARWLPGEDVRAGRWWWEDPGQQGVRSARAEDGVSAHPLFLRLEGRVVLVVGGGPVACDKACALGGEPARGCAWSRREVRAELARGRRGGAPARLRAGRSRRRVAGGGGGAAGGEPPGARSRPTSSRRFVVAVDDVANCSGDRRGLPAARSAHLRAVVGRRGAGAGVAPAPGARRAPARRSWRSGCKVARTERAAWKADKTPFARRRPRLLEALTALYSGESVKP